MFLKLSPEALNLLSHTELYYESGKVYFYQSLCFHGITEKHLITKTAKHDVETSVVRYSISLTNKFQKLDTDIKKNIYNICLLVSRH